MRHGPWIAALALLLGARPADANRVQLGLRYDHAVDMARSEWAPRYWQGLTLAGQLRFLRLAKVGCQVGVLAPVVAGERSDAEAPVLSDTRVLGGVVIPTGARWVVPEVGFALVAPTSAFSRRSGLVLGLAPRARVTLRAGDRVRLGAGFAGLHYLRQRPRTDGWTDEVNAFIEVEGSVGPGMLYNYLQSTDRLTRWHLPTRSTHSSRSRGPSDRGCSTTTCSPPIGSPGGTLTRGSRAWSASARGSASPWRCTCSRISAIGC